MAQPTNLLGIEWDPSGEVPITPGVDLAKYRLYYRDSGGLAQLAGDDQDGALFYPVRNLEKAGGPAATFATLGAGRFQVLASGAITKEDPVTTASSGRVRKALPGDRVRGRAWQDVADGEVVTILTQSAEGANASGGVAVIAKGTATLSGGTVTVDTTAVKTGDIILVSPNTPAGTPEYLSAPSASITDATSFVINSGDGSNSDTSTVNYVILRAV